MRGFLSPDRQVDGEEIPIYILLNTNVSAVGMSVFLVFLFLSALFILWMEGGKKPKRIISKNKKQSP